MKSSSSMNDESINDDSNYFLHIWQKRTMDIDEQNSNDEVDTHRFCMSQLKFLQCKGLEYQNSWQLENILRELRIQYNKLLDSKEKVNNYAPPILSLSKSFNKPNQSKTWKCHITADDLKKHLKTTKLDDDIFNKEYIKLSKLIKESKSFEVKDLKTTNADIKENFEELSIKKKSNFYPINNNSGISSEKIQIGNISNSALDKNAKKRFLEDNLGIRKPVIDQINSANALFSNNFTETNYRLKEKDYNESKRSNRGGKKYPWEVAKYEECDKANPTCFKTASQQLQIENVKKFGNRYPEQAAGSNTYGSQKRSLGARRGINSKFMPPIKRDEEEYGDQSGSLSRNNSNGGQHGDSPYAELMMDERMKNIDIKMVELIMNEIMDNGAPVSWDDIAGLELAKNTIKEIVVWPMLRPDIFTGLRGPPKGLLLFGPPGTGKTMIGKCIASQSHSTFFSISASSLTSKWVGEGEKMVRAMFAVAKCHQPAVIFIDEIDSLLTQRSETEHESSRRIKTEFLVQLDGATSGDDERLLVVGATNRPQELDEAARRRLVKRLYIPLPDTKARQYIIKTLLANQNHRITPEDIYMICDKAEGYSGADMANLCREAALGPIRDINFADIERISVDEVRPIMADDFTSALCSIRASVSDQDLNLYEDWNRKYGITSK